MDKFLWMMKYGSRLWMLLPVIFIIGHIVKGIINKELMNIAIAIICLISYPIWYLFIYIIGYNNIKYGYIAVWILKFFMPFFVLLIAVDYTEDHPIEYRRWIQIYGGLFTVFAFIKIINTIFYSNLF